MDRDFYVLGIDPGWKSLGWSLNQHGAVVGKGNFNPSECDTITNAVRKLLQELNQHFDLILDDYNLTVYMERFVSYNNVMSAASEDILMMIGAIYYGLDAYATKIHMLRAIDWKQIVSKYLVRTKDFSNPSSSFDKKFSIAAAEALSGLKLKSDHEADAICLSYLTEIRNYENDRRNNGTKTS